MNGIRVLMIGASLEQKGGIATVEKLMLKYAPKSIVYTHISSHEEGSKIQRILVFFKAWLRLVGTCLFGRTDLVHIHVSDGGSILRKVILSRTAFLFRKPVLMHANGAEFHLTHEKHSRWMQKWSCTTFQKCSFFLVVTKHWKDYYIQTMSLAPERVLLIPNPAELPDQVPDRAGATIAKMAFCGRIGERKGAFDLIHAFANLPAEIKQKAEIIMAGDGEVEKAKNLAQEIGVVDYIQFPGWVDRDGIKQILKASHIFLLPSYNEGLPLALLDAMGWGLPAITTPVSGIPDLVQSDVNGILVNPGDIPALTEAMRRLIENKETRQAMGRQARTTVEPFEVRNFCDRLSKIYESMIRPS